MTPNAPIAGSCIVRLAQWTSLSLGALLSMSYLGALTAGELGRRGDIEAFAAPPPDLSLWSQSRKEQFLAAVRLPISEPAAILRARSLKLTVPVYAESSDVHLNRGVVLIEGMSTPDQGGNVGVAGHRDGFFRVLKDIKRNDVVELQTRARVHRYRIVSLDIVDASERSVLKDTKEPTLTLVTCYPFYHVGRAPQRFIVRGKYIWTESATESATTHRL